jgi:phenylacetic acid degradation operon negative regulatory protein
LRTKDRILIALSLLGDAALYAYVKGSGWRKGSFFDFLDIRKSVFQASVWRSLKTGDIEKVIKNGQPCFRITSGGKNYLTRIFPIYRLADSAWDRKWRVVIFDIPEIDKKAREHLRQKLVSLGFGKLQKSVYVSPLDVLADLEEYLLALHLYGRVIVFEAKEVFVKDQRLVANFVWKLDKLNERYLALMGRIYRQDEFSPREWGKEAKKIKEDFFQILLDDPFLPKELLPENWAGGTARVLIAKLI